MKKLTKQILLLVMAVIMLFTCVACGGGKTNNSEKNSEKDSQATSSDLKDFEAVSLDDGKAGEVYTLSYTDGQSYEDAVLPEKHFQGPTTATLEFVGTKAYEATADMIGPLGSFTHETNPELLTMFQEAIATVDDEMIPKKKTGQMQIPL